MVHFDTLFDLTSHGGASSSFRTGPEDPATHWKQVALYLEPSRELKPGDQLRGSVSCARRADYKRGYEVAVTFAINGEECGTQLWKL